MNFVTRFDNDEKISKVHTKGYFQSVKMIVYARAEAIDGTIDNLFYNARRQKLIPAQVFGKSLPFKHLDLWLACPPNRSKPATIELFRKTVISLWDKGSFQEIIGRHL